MQEAEAAEARMLPSLDASLDERAEQAAKSKVPHNPNIADNDGLDMLGGRISPRPSPGTNK